MVIEIKFVKTVVMDTETNEIISSVETVETSNSSVESSKKTTKQKKVVTEDGAEPQLKIESNKIVLNKQLTDLINAVPGDRVCISYLNDGNDYFPVISKSGVFNDAEAGNKLTKSLTSSFRGKQLEMLTQYGNCFSIVKLDTLPEGAFKLKDLNFVEIETVKEEELVEMPKVEELQVEDNFGLNSSETLEDQKGFINFDFNFDNI